MAEELSMVAICGHGRGGNDGRSWQTGGGCGESATAGTAPSGPTIGRCGEVRQSHAWTTAACQHGRGTWTTEEAHRRAA